MTDHTDPEPAARPEARPPRRTIVRAVLRAVGSTAALVAIYYLLPLDRSSTWVAVTMLVIGLVLLIALADPQAHGRADRQGADVASGEPPGVTGLDLVTARAAAQRASTEAYRERLAHQPGTWVGDDVSGVGVDADQAGDLHGDAGLLGGLPDRRIGRALARIDVPAGQFLVAGVAAAHQQHPAGDVADRGESARGHVAGGGGPALAGNGAVSCDADRTAPRWTGG